MTGIERIAAERKRQIEAEGWTAAHDLQHRHGELAMVACAYALPWAIDINGEYDCDSERLFRASGWADKYYKSLRQPRLRQLEIAGALIAAEIDRQLMIEKMESEWEEENAR